MSIRCATHAGSWYRGSKLHLETQLDQFLDNVPKSGFNNGSMPIPGARFLVAPHAGYSYAGQTMAEAYKAWDISKIKRVFVVGPSHHAYFKGAQLSQFAAYETPLGNVPVDTAMTEELLKTGLFGKMTASADEEEHSIEIHIPFIHKMTAASDGGVQPIVPILIGQSVKSFEEKLAKTLAPYFDNEENACVISTDFCHWGERFNYTVYTDSEAKQLIKLANKCSVDLPVPIFKSIEALDKLGMVTASSGSYDAFNKYLDETENTICGRHPLAIFLKTIEETKGRKRHANYGLLKWIGYAQSSKVTSPMDSSVSYASGFAVA